MKQSASDISTLTVLRYWIRLDRLQSVACTTRLSLVSSARGNLARHTDGPPTCCRRDGDQASGRVQRGAADPEGDAPDAHESKRGRSSALAHGFASPTPHGARCPTAQVGRARRSRRTHDLFLPVLGRCCERSTTTLLEY
eukprot:scaffold121285_cov31-Tisochrysis_lutea.AAC.1